MHLTLIRASAARARATIEINPPGVSPLAGRQLICVRVIRARAPLIAFSLSFFLSSSSFFFSCFFIY